MWFQNLHPQGRLKVTLKQNDLDASERPRIFIPQIGVDKYKDDWYHVGFRHKKDRNMYAYVDAPLIYQ